MKKPIVITCVVRGNSWTDAPKFRARSLESGIRTAKRKLGLRGAILGRELVGSSQFAVNVDGTIMMVALSCAVSRRPTSASWWSRRAPDCEASCDRPDSPVLRGGVVSPALSERERQMLVGMRDACSGDVAVQRDESAPMLWSIWTEDDILGAGPTFLAAAADAIQTIEQWDGHPRARLRIDDDPESDCSIPEFAAWNDDLDPEIIEDVLALEEGDVLEVDLGAGGVTKIERLVRGAS